jgi:hypothetical protein
MVLGLLSLGLTAASAKDAWFYGALLAGLQNSGGERIEGWGELTIQNFGKRAETLRVTVRRYNGEAVLAADYSVAPGEKRVIRIDDPKVEDASFDDLAGSKARCTVLIEPVSSRITIEMRQMILRGDRLTTGDLPSVGEVRKIGNEVTRLEPGWHYFGLSNLSGVARMVTVCKTIYFNPMLGCIGSQSFQYTVLPFTTIFSNAFSVPDGGYLVFLKPKDVIAGDYIPRQGGATSTFDVKSDISFGPVVRE